MMTGQRNDGSKLQKILFVSVIAVYPAIYIFQGIDFTDFGYSASTYKFIFSNPEALYTSFFPTYLTNILGGVVHVLLGRWGLISFKIAYVAELYLICYLVYRVLIRFFNNQVALLSLLVSIIYINYYKYGTLNWINYNDLSALFYVFTAFFLLRSLETPNKYVYWAGFCIGLNFFIRVSNLAGLLVAVVFIVDYFCEEKKALKQLVRRLVFFGLGILTGVGAVFLIMITLGHFKLYIASYRLLADFSSLTPDHNMKSQLMLYFYDLVQSFWTATFFLFCGLILLLLVKYVWVSNRILLTAFGLLIGFFLVSSDVGDRIREAYAVRWIFWQSGIVVFLLLYLMCNSYKTNYPLLRFALFSLIILIITPLGSGRSLLNANFGMWLALPLLISAFLSRAISLKVFFLKEYSYYLLNVIVLSIISFYGIKANFHEVYRDSPDRSQLTVPIDHEYFRGIYTTAARAASINEFMQALSLYISPSDYVLGHEYFSMANYLADRPPYMFNPNPMYFSPEVYKFLYDKAREEIHTLPVILSAKGSFGKNWPSGRGLKHPDPARDRLRNQQREFIESLKKEGRYQKVWQNDFFEIWRTGDAAHNNWIK